MTTRARLADIAAKAGVSEATVSRVLNGKPGVAEDTKQSVLTALDVLGFERPTRLRRRSAGLIGLVMPELINPIFPAFAQVIESALSQRGFTPVLCTQSPSGATEEEYVEMLLERGVSGIIFVSGLHADTGADHERYQSLVERRLPVVFVNGWLPEVQAPFVSSDDNAAMELAVTHLVALGHRRIGFASGPERFIVVQRKLAGYRTSMKAQLGVTDEDLDPFVSLSMFGVEGGQAAAQPLLDAGVSAIVCGSDMMALGVIRAARQRGLAVPADLSVVGYDDAPMMEFTDPPMTTIRQPVQSMALAAVQSLLEEVRGHATPKTEFLFRPELVVRNTTGPAR
ncbi:LacI family DNA-binding transcriptional regulator [Kribbella albertanoniae]|uniref:LacI family transcriptional regulator n=1 Tax=Kribbella albertanoniae TaxID=1266829 RepID=A0A4R4PRL5_9ACTN|nr:LacI family DNA-binding transcriptional regulator [Kribbella albertanoniae]TDC24932.1 LacI family transcriptional regulator [Kribbella albertanoniae]